MDALNRFTRGSVLLITLNFAAIVSLAQANFFIPQGDSDTDKVSIRKSRVATFAQVSLQERSPVEFMENRSQFITHNS